MKEQNKNTREIRTYDIQLSTFWGSIKVRSKITQEIGSKTVCIQHGWWQSCPELGLPGYDPYTFEGANANLLCDNELCDPISGSVHIKGIPCRIDKLEEQLHLKRKINIMNKIIL